MAKRLSEFPVLARVYVLAVVVVGTGILLASIVQTLDSPPSPDWLILAGLTLFTGTFGIKVPSVSARISVSEAFVFAAVLLFTPAIASIIVAIDTLILTLWSTKKNRSLVRTLFNISAGVSAIWTAAIVFNSLLTSPDSAEIGQLLFPVLAMALTYFAINSTLIATVVAIDRGVTPISIWQHSFSALSLQYIGGASVALVLVTYTRRVDLTAIGVIVPLLVITYLTFRSSMGRLDDADRHIAQLNEMYLSTVEALAMAVDAKDQITHGHIRRVQVYTVELAKRLGVKHEHQLKAIETAALLHDMGKLAIPEHILNKPGKLTAAEFDKMKRHADLGADLLSSIKFPYPVVPIVRHHHENWDGTGYPSGISGTDIPLGARILSVVDCFDALTSDRPYRPRLSNDDAFAILRKRRGSMYDPLVVDTFIRSFSEISPAAIRAGQEARSIFGEADASDEAPKALVLQQIRANATEAALLSECGTLIRQAASRREACEVAARVLRHLTPATVYALYRYEPDLDGLRCEYAIGDVHRLLQGLTIRLGERITGWSGANLQTAINSDAVLDLAKIATAFTPPLRSAMTTPLAHGNRLLGVLSAYSAKQEAFGDVHLYAFEQVAGMLCDRLLALAAGGPTVLSFPLGKQS